MEMETSQCSPRKCVIVYGVHTTIILRKNYKNRKSERDFSPELLKIFKIVELVTWRGQTKATNKSALNLNSVNNVNNHSSKFQQCH